MRISASLLRIVVKMNDICPVLKYKKTSKTVQGRFAVVWKKQKGVKEYEKTILSGSAHCGNEFVLCASS
jgi:hypothetical protein